MRWPDGRSKALLFDGAPIMPSAVYAAEDGSILAGRDAVHSARLHPHRFEPYPKRRIDEETVYLGDREIRSTELIATVLRRVALEAHRVANATPSHVTLTHPAAWGAQRRDALGRAAAAAGLPQPLLVAEPVAAASYFVGTIGAHLPIGGCAVVYDFGAGTFDATVVRRTAAGGFDVLATEGLTDAGGLDVDAAIVTYLGRQLADRAADEWRRLSHPADDTDRRAAWQLWEDARQAKETLSRAATTYVHVPLVDDSVPLGREQLEQLARPILDRTVTATLLSVAAAGLTPAQLSAVFLVGGSSRIPLAATLLHRGFGTAPMAIEQPELVVAEGALQLAPRSGRAVVGPPPSGPGAAGPLVAGPGAAASGTGPGTAGPGPVSPGMAGPRPASPGVGGPAPQSPHGSVPQPPYGPGVAAPGMGRPNDRPVSAAPMSGPPVSGPPTPVSGTPASGTPMSGVPVSGSGGTPVSGPPVFGGPPQPTGPFPPQSSAPPAATQPAEPQTFTMPSAGPAGPPAPAGGYAASPGAPSAPGTPPPPAGTPSPPQPGTTYGAPQQASGPWQPGQQAQPGQPGQPGHPGQQGYPGQPGQQGYPGQQGQQGYPGQPGQPGQPMSGPPFPGQPHPSQPHPSQPHPSPPQAGQPMQAQPGVTGQQPIPGRPMSGPPMSGPPMSGPPMSGPPMSGPPMSGPPMSGAPVSGAHGVPMGSFGPGGPPRRSRGPLVGALAAGAVVLLLVVGGIVFALTRPEPEPPPETPVAAACGYKVAYLGILSGDNSGDGKAIRNSAKLAVDKYNAAHQDCTAELVEYDTQGDEDEAGRMAGEIVRDEKVVGVVGPIWFTEAEKAMPIFDAAGLPVISPSLMYTVLSQKGWKTFHRTVGTDADQAAAAARHLTQTMGARRVFVVSDTDEYATGVANEARRALNTAFIGRADIAGNETTFASVVSQVTSSTADAVYFSGYHEAASIFVKEMKAAKSDIKIMGWDRIFTDLFIEGATAAVAEGVAMTCPCAPPSEARNNFATEYREKFGESAGYYGPESFDAANVLLAALAAGKSVRADVNAFVGAYDSQGVSRQIKFTPTGDLDTSTPTVWSYVVRGGSIYKDRVVA
ncbi:ABC transporter substrate-binding protein [Virgisporangium ochraceum]|uniref:ABC transporter substrate-binding protein n=1 Tax=Virgisporangium ochraceum TaxID=65505 RepID=UPI0019436684|nr:ABC transporter substrate-binding protein [Virgisporangium ochraceum]